MECKKGSLILLRHNEIRDELAFLASQALTPSSVRDEPFIYPCRPATMESSPATGLPATTDPATPPSPVERNLRKNAGSAERGDILIRNCWTQGTDCIIDVRVTDTDAASYRSRPPEKVLAEHERAKKRKYLEACQAQRRDFTPFVVSADGLLGKEAKTLLRQLSSRLAEKYEKAYSQVCGFVMARMSIAIVRATHLCLRGSRIPTRAMSRHQPLWEDGAGISLFRY